MIARILALALGLFTGVAASQAPEFAQQYRQRIGGAIDELRRVTARFDEDARAENLSREQAIARLSSQDDPVARRQGPAAAETADRLERLERQRDAVAEAGPFVRLAAVARGFDGPLARATYLDFEPAWPATTEGLVTGGVGFLIGWLGLRGLFSGLGRIRLRRSRTVPKTLRTA